MYSGILSTREIFIPCLSVAENAGILTFEFPTPNHVSPLSVLLSPRESIRGRVGSAPLSWNAWYSVPAAHGILVPARVRKSQKPRPGPKSSTCMICDLLLEALSPKDCRAFSPLAALTQDGPVPFLPSALSTPLRDSYEAKQDPSPRE